MFLLRSGFFSVYIKSESNIYPRDTDTIYSLKLVLNTHTSNSLPAFNKITNV